MTKKRTKTLRHLGVFLVLFLFWLVLSGHYDPLHLSMGLMCAGLVSFFSSDLLFPDLPAHGTLIRTWRFLRYIPWLLYQVVLANLHVVYLVFRPSLINPRIVYFKSRLRTDLSRVTLGNSITLTPGTITMDINDREFRVHALSDKVAQALLAGEMERRVAHVFLEPEHEDSIEAEQ